VMADAQTYTPGPELLRQVLRALAAEVGQKDELVAPVRARCEHEPNSYLRDVLCKLPTRQASWISEPLLHCWVPSSTTT